MVVPHDPEVASELSADIKAYGPLGETGASVLERRRSAGGSSEFGYIGRCYARPIESGGLR